MKSHAYLLLFTALLFSSFLQAQTRDTFPTEQSAFIDALEEYVTRSKSKLSENTWKDFDKQVIKVGALDGDQWQEVAATAERMRSNRMNANYFLPYLNNLMYMQQQNAPQEQFRQWHGIFNALLDDIEVLRLNKLKAFLDFSANFYEKQALRYNKVGTTWKATAPPAQMAYEKEQLSITYTRTNLIAQRQNDSILIYDTEGTFYPFEDRWEGQGGSINWERYQFPELYAELGVYTIDFTKPTFDVSEVVLHHPTYFPGRTIKGTLSDGIQALKDSATTGRYPVFTSADSVLQIEKIGKGVRYVGGFKLIGTTVNGFGRGDQPARLEVFSANGARVFKGFANLFAIQQGAQVASKSVNATLYYGQDSITHPSVLLRYKIPTRTFTLDRADDAGGRNPFFDSYQNINMDVENLEWTVGADSIIFGKRTIGFGTSSDEAIFESLGYYSEVEYRRMQSLGSYNPIATFRRVAREQGTDVLSANLLAEELDSRLTLERIQGTLFDMAKRGFVDYNADKKLVTIKPKLYHYADAGIKKTDYDHLRISSKVNRAINARLNLTDQSIVVNGVQNIEFSPKQKVAIKPNGSQISLTGDRNMDLSGRVFAGYGVFIGKDFHFEYQPFHVVMDSVRYMDLFVPNGEEDRNGQPVALSLASRIEHLSGTLLIDAPINKSGEKDIPLFPAFNSEGYSYVYYDDKKTLGGVYKRDSFYFQLDPFSLNGLDELQAEQVTFDGTLVSAEIFEDITETLEIQEDQSLGLFTETPEEGQGIYQAKGNYTGEMSLSNKGFYGKGQLQYLGTTIDAEDYTFMPKLMTCSAEEFLLKEDRNLPEFPYAYGIGVNIEWKPYADSMYIRSDEAPFELFTAEDYYLEGILVLTPLDLRAQGKLDWPDATFSSTDMGMGAYSTQADTGAIAIKALEEEGEIALSNPNVQADMDFDEQYGSFTSNLGDIPTSLPYNFYETTMNAFDWDMEEQRIIFKNAEGVLSNFLSVHPDKDSIQFQGAEADYDLLTSELRIGGIPYIISCDALIYPDSQQVRVQKGGDMSELLNARILASLENRQHEITRANMILNGRKDFLANGFYKYNVGQWEQEIYFDNIVGSRVGKGKRSEKATETRATGTVEEEVGFHIDHLTEFAGEISLNSNSSALHFEGFARLDVPDLPQREWFSLDSDGDRRDLIIAFDEPKTYGGEPVRSGFYLSKETAEVYPRVMQPLFFRKDRPIIDTRGYMDYDEDKQRFRFGDSTKILAYNNRGALMEYVVPSGKIVAEGKFNIGSGLDYVKVDAAGMLLTSFRQDADSFSLDGTYTEVIETPPVDSLLTDSLGMDSIQVEEPIIDPFLMGADMPRIAEQVNAKMIAGVTFPLPSNLITIMLTDFNASAFSAPAVNHIPLPFYEKAISELITDDDVMESIMRDLRSANDLNIPRKSNPYTFLFSKLDMSWNQEYQSWFSQTNQVGLASIAGVPINKQFKTFVEFKMPTNGDDRMYIYVESPGGYFYFFGYKQGIMNTVSNNTTFNDAVLALKKKDVIQKMDDGGFYEIQLVEKGTARAFMNRVLEGRK